jgi:hypothetical protein
MKEHHVDSGGGNKCYGEAKEDQVAVRMQDVRYRL